MSYIANINHYSIYILTVCLAAYIISSTILAVSNTIGQNHVIRRCGSYSLRKYVCCALAFTAIAIIIDLIALNGKTFENLFALAMNVCSAVSGGFYIFYIYKLFMYNAIENSVNSIEEDKKDAFQSDVIQELYEYLRSHNGFNGSKNENCVPQNAYNEVSHSNTANIPPKHEPSTGSQLSFRNK